MTRFLQNLLRIVVSLTLPLLVACEKIKVSATRPQDGSEGVGGYIIRPDKIALKRVPEGLEISAPAGTATSAFPGVPVQSLRVALHLVTAGTVESVRLSVFGRVSLPGAFAGDFAPGLDGSLSAKLPAPGSFDRALLTIDGTSLPDSARIVARGLSETNAVLFDLSQDPASGAAFVRAPIQTSFLSPFSTRLTLQALDREARAFDLAGSDGSSRRINLVPDQATLVEGLAAGVNYQAQVPVLGDTALVFRTLARSEPYASEIPFSESRCYTLMRTAKVNPITGTLTLSGHVDDRICYGEYDGTRWRHLVLQAGPTGPAGSSSASRGNLEFDRSGRAWLKTYATLPGGNGALEIRTCETRCLEAASWKKSFGPLDSGTQVQQSLLFVDKSADRIVAAVPDVAAGNGFSKLFTCGGDLAACAEGRGWSAAIPMMAGGIFQGFSTSQGSVISDSYDTYVARPWIHVCRSGNCPSQSDWISGRLRGIGHSYGSNFRLQQVGNVLYAASVGTAWGTNRDDRATYGLRIAQCDTAQHDCFERDAQNVFVNFTGDDTFVAFPSSTNDIVDVSQAPVLGSGGWLYGYQFVAMAPPYPFTTSGDNLAYVRRCASGSCQSVSDWANPVRMSSNPFALSGLSDVLQCADGSVGFPLDNRAGFTIVFP